jgi:hypothetical protein
MKPIREVAGDEELLTVLRRLVKAVSQLLWPYKDREVWFSLGENHEKACSFGLYQLRNCHSPKRWCVCSFYQEKLHLAPFNTYKAIGKML